MHIRHQSTVSPRKASRHISSGSMPHSTLDQSISVPSGAHSLAHELAVALMPEPAAGAGASRLLAEEFGIEYDEGAEGIDDDLVVRTANGDADILDDGVADVPGGGTSLADELGGGDFGDSLADEMSGAGEETGHAINNAEPDAWNDEIDRGSEDEDEDDASRGTTPAQDAMEILAQNLASTDNFLAHLRTIDMPPPSSPSPSYSKTSFATHNALPGSSSQVTSSSTFTIEGFASDIIRRINDAVREREGQLRELIAYDRDLKRISGEVGGTDVLGDLEPLEDLLGEDEHKPRHTPSASTKLNSVIEEDEGDRADMEGEGDSLYNATLPVSPRRVTFASPPSSAPPQTVSNPSAAGKTPSPSAISSLAVVVPSLANIRVHTASLLSSLTTISEQAQVNGAATADAGRKVRSLKNRLGGWKIEWEGAERSRTKIERWEAESKTITGGRKDGRAIVAEHMTAFEKAITEAGMKTQAIMAR
ncbi:hypothetical protein ID866_3827 [Astraeus odoratus]|nr:hypothetical protein ID866_3827 [Astraeus odoratus]